MKRFQVTLEEAQQAHLRWNGEHVGVRWEVAYWGYPTMNDGCGMWNRYIIIPEAMIPDEFPSFWLEPHTFGLRNNHVGYHYEDTKLADLEWNGGATHYSKLGGPDAQERGIKIGCDYGHLWDMEQGYPYCLSRIRRDAEITCEAFRKMFPNSLYRCTYSGTYHPLAEMLVHPTNDTCWYWSGNSDKVWHAWKPGRPATDMPSNPPCARRPRMSLETGR